MCRRSGLMGKAKILPAVMLLLAAAASSKALAATTVPLPAAAVLARVSLTLRGRLPTPAETAAFTAAAGTDAKSFVAAYASRLDDFFADPAFVTAVDSYHQMWWHLPAGESTRLAAYIVTHDRPYSELFAKDYLYVDGQTAQTYDTLGVLTESPLPGGSDPYTLVRLSPAEDRFRSIFANFDFLSRFPDSPTNRNRKRANQIFRSFLCENITNAALPGVTTLPPGPHGTSPECLGCHTRLDPMARFFDRWPPLDPTFMQPVYDGTKAAAGAIVLKGTDGRAVNYPGATDKGLGALLLKLPQAQQCIVQKVWEFAVGPNVKLPPATRQELTRTLATTGHFKAALKVAFLHPYLWSTETPPPLNFTDVAPLLQVCVTCHATGHVSPVFTATAYPFRADPAANKQVLQSLYGAASGDANYPRMPPGTQPTMAPESLAKLRDWISGGALDEHLQPTITDNDTREILDD